MAQRVLVLNASYEPINVTSLHRAVVLVLKEKAEVLEAAAIPIRTSMSSFVKPQVIRLVYLVRVPRYEARKITRRALFARDGYSCQYCGSSARLQGSQQQSWQQQSWQQRSCPDPTRPRPSWP